MPPRPERELRRVLIDPAAFARGALGVDLWETQSQILRAVAKYPRVAVKACHASSKTFTAAIAALWWVTRFRDGMVLVTAPTRAQVRGQVWEEIARLVSGSRIGYPPVGRDEFRVGPGRAIVARATDQGVRLQGYHGRILVIIDEAPGVEADIWEAIETMAAGGEVHVLALGNPTSPGGPFHQAFTKERSLWKTFTISAFDTPNLKGLTVEELLKIPEDDLDVGPRPYLVTARWVRERWEAWGRHGAPQWRSRVLGEFPEEAENSLFRLEWLDQWQRADAPQSGGAVEVGIDVAAGGSSETVVAIRQNGMLLGLHAFVSSDPRGQVAAVLEPLRGRLGWVKVDADGPGHYFGQHFVDLGHNVLLVHVGVPSSSPLRFANLKAELYWQLRDWAAEGQLSGLKDDLAYAQLASLRYELTPRGQVAMESKDLMRKRGIPSPDRAEAIMLAFAPLRPEEQQIVIWDDPVHISDY